MPFLGGAGPAQQAMTKVSAVLFVVLASSAQSFSVQWSAATAAELGVGACAAALSAPERHTVAEVKDGETLVLANGTAVRLIGAKAPVAPLSQRADQPWPFAAEATEALRALAKGTEIELRYGGNRTDRHGRALAQVFVVKGDERVWLQGEMIAKGLARTYSFPDNRACVAEVLSVEAETRGKRVGLWGSATYAVLDASDPERLGRLTRSFQVVEGVVTAIGESRARLYLNFAQDWRSDFTVSVARNEEKEFAASKLDLRSLAGKRIRVRGWIEWRNGPMIEANHAEQIEILRTPAETGAVAGSDARPL